MLFENVLQDGDIVTIKMISGEEAIAKFVGFADSDMTSYKIQRPLILTQTQRGPALAPFIITAVQGATLTIDRGAFVCITKSDSEMATQYIEVTTGIKVSSGENLLDL